MKHTFAKYFLSIFIFLLGGHAVLANIAGASEFRIVHEIKQVGTASANSLSLPDFYQSKHAFSTAEKSDYKFEEALFENEENDNNEDEFAAFKKYLDKKASIITAFFSQASKLVCALDQKNPFSIRFFRTHHLLDV